MLEETDKKWDSDYDTYTVSEELMTDMNDMMNDIQIRII